MKLVLALAVLVCHAVAMDDSLRQQAQRALQVALNFAERSLEHLIPLPGQSLQVPPPAPMVTVPAPSAPVGTGMVHGHPMTCPVGIIACPQKLPSNQWICPGCERRTRQWDVFFSPTLKGWGRYVRCSKKLSNGEWCDQELVTLGGIKGYWIPTEQQIDGHQFLLISKWDTGLAKLVLGGKGLARHKKSETRTINVQWFDEMRARRHLAVLFAYTCHCIFCHDSHACFL